jgi:predicted HicB family RNase H-like nuclease
MGSADYLKIVEWSEDGCYVGSAPPIIGGACHGGDQVKVYRQLCQIVDEWLEIMERDGMPVPAATAGKEYSGTFNLRAGPDLHKALEIRATQAGESLNSYCVQQLGRAVTRQP